MTAPAHALRVTSPTGFVSAHPHASSIGAQLEIAGRARAGTPIEVRVTCQLGPCTTTTTANRRGRFTAVLNLVLPHGRRNVRVRVNDWARTFPLDQPDYAAVSPYSDDADVPELNVIGDSLAVGTDASLRMLLPGWRVTTDARVGRPLAEGMDVLGMTPLPDRPRALAFSLFTNDDPGNLESLRSAVEASLARSDCVIWATIARDGRSYRAANRMLRDEDRISVVDWARAAGRHPEWLRDDGVHPTPAGYVARARLYARAALACARAAGWR